MSCLGASAFPAMTSTELTHSPVFCRGRVLRYGKPHASKWNSKLHSVGSGLPPVLSYTCGHGHHHSCPPATTFGCGSMNKQDVLGSLPFSVQLFWENSLSYPRSQSLRCVYGWPFAGLYKAKGSLDQQSPVHQRACGSESLWIHLALYFNSSLLLLTSSSVLVAHLIPTSTSVKLWHVLLSTQVICKHFSSGSGEAGEVASSHNGTSHACHWATKTF